MKQTIYKSESLTNHVKYMHLFTRIRHAMKATYTILLYWASEHAVLVCYVA